MLRFQRDRVMAEDELRKLIGGHGFTIANLSCCLIEGGQQFEYRMTIKSQDRKNGERLAVHLRGLPEVVEFRIAATSRHNQTETRPLPEHPFIRTSHAIRFHAAQFG